MAEGGSGWSGGARASAGGYACGQRELRLASAQTRSADKGPATAAAATTAAQQSYRATEQQRDRLPLTDQKRAGNAQGTCGRRNPVNSAKFLPAALAIFSAVIV